MQAIDSVTKARRVVAGCLCALLAYHITLTTCAIVAYQYRSAFHAVESAGYIDPELDRLASELECRMESEPAIGGYRQELERVLLDDGGQDPDRTGDIVGAKGEEEKECAHKYEPNALDEIKRPQATVSQNLSEAAKAVEEDGMTQQSVSAIYYQWNWAGICIAGIGLLGAIVIGAMLGLSIWRMRPKL